jgi:hypothetical protein
MRTILRVPVGHMSKILKDVLASVLSLRIVLVLLFSAAFGSIELQAQSDRVNVSFTRIPFSDPEIMSPGRGAEIWHNEFGPNIVNTISESVHESPKDIYVRSQLTWDRLEPSRDVYDFSFLDEIFRSAIPFRRKVGFCIITQWPDRDLAGVSYDGYPSSYPRYLHDLMQAEAVNSRDYVRANTWIPNYNSPSYLSRFEALLRAIANHINTTSFQGVPYREVLGYVDIGGYGSWGEWNQVFVHNDYNDYPTGRMPTYQSLNRILDAHVAAFPDHQLIMNISVLDGRQFPNVWIPVETGYHALNLRNNFGLLGISKKSWGWPSSWFCEQWLDRHPRVYNGMRFDTAAGNRWRHAPINGEGPGGGTAIDENGAGGRPFMNLLPAQVRRFHISQLGNGNFGGEHQGSVAGRDSLRAAWKLMGYRIVLAGGNMSAALVPGLPMAVSLQWQNVGVAPIYEHWNVTYELQNQSTNAVVWTGNSSHELRLWLPQPTPTTVNDNFTLPGTLAPGTYRLVVRVVDPAGYREPLPLAIRGRRPDGSYLIRENITVSAAGSNVVPVANAGADQTITLPTSTVTLNGSGTDADGSIASFRWSKVSGPAGGAIASPNTATTSITGLTAGTHVYRLTVTDNVGASASDDVTIVVNTSTAPSPTNRAPVANAGADRSITLPTNSVTLTGTGSDPDGTISSFAWSRVSGPAGGNIQSPTAASTQITAMVAGTYVFRLTVTDNNGAIASDDVQVVVNPAPAPAANQPPIANAGANITITLPTNAVTLNGSGSDPDGSIAGYSWTKVSGPAGGNIQSATTASTQITGMIAGTYVFRLTVRDNLGAQGTDDVQIIVNPAPVPVNQAPVANAGRDISITLPVDSAQLNGSASRDPDGSIVSYSWRKVSGPAGGNLNNPRIVNPMSRGMMQGTYEFELQVTDNRGATHTDRVTVTVIRINRRPVITTADTLNVMLPVQNTELNASASYDPDGRINTFQWSYVSGPRSPRILNPASSRTVVADLVEGTYQFRVEATDNDGDRSSKAVVVIVSPNNGRRIVPEVDVYPNPAVSNVNIQVTSELNGRTVLTFYDMNGRPVMTDIFTKATRRQTREVNISRLPKGTYGVLVQVDQAERVVEKVIKY